MSETTPVTTKLSETMTLKRFFGFRTNDGLKDFHDEIKALSLESKSELASLAKSELIRRGECKPDDFGF